MKLFGWMQSKFNGHGQKHSNAAKASRTFGNNDLPVEKENPVTETSSPDLSEFTPEEIGKLQNELTKLLSKKQEIPADLPLDRFLNCPSSLEVDRRLSVTANTEEVNEKEEDIDRTIRVILGRCKDICVDSGKKTVGTKKSISFLLKKIFVCSSGLPTIPGLRDPLPESRMEKILRAMLKNKINPQHSQASSGRKFLEGRRLPKNGKVLEDENEKEISKWVKTDSEYIVLEI
ncbi:hypothetical protein Tco_1171195 [Tanacetum coccineum]